MSSKTQPPSARRLREAAKRGELAWSPPLSAASTLLLASVIMLMTAPVSLGLYVRLLLAALDSGEMAVLRDAALPVLAIAMGAVATTAALLIVIASLAQTRMQVASEGLRLRVDRLNPARGLKNMFSADKAAELLTTMLLAGVCVVALLYFAADGLPALPAATGLDPAQQLLRLTDAGLRQLAATAAALLPLALADLWLRKRLRLRSLRMTVAEARRETHEEEGRPEVRQRTRQEHQDMVQTNAPAPS
ncbi:MAG TPA: EscU/YscU/HrcU family type III secretion system export apparatus switch protein [Stenotrophomonas sp.]|nr:EscU/YscU/HrcU family type III secretion system export apparatus switch protein [Stenotrophomonas sp.]